LYKVLSIQSSKNPLKEQPEREGEEESSEFLERTSTRERRIQ
jgi:hypothetical protein